jgi:serine/threonine protein kinase
MRTTKYSRGTGGYRAPEILHDEAAFNTKADIWALGCVLYETACGVKMFQNDTRLLLCSLYGRLDFPIPWAPPTSIATTSEVDVDQMMYARLHEIIFQTVQLDPNSRPSSHAIVAGFVPKFDNLNLSFPEAVVFYHTHTINFFNVCDDFLRMSDGESLVEDQGRLSGGFDRATVSPQIVFNLTYCRSKASFELTKPLKLPS